ncbi:MAG: CinA family protein [Alphaproteobacteria bacterium]|nr:CinA family protein [Alphaproteobacteria bacterium]
MIGAYKRANKKIVTAESCTGGLVAGLLTSVSGSSAVMERGFITYSNDAKVEVLGVLPELLQSHGAVSAEVAEAMALGALEFSLADVAVSVTGVAGPDGGTTAKPVGLVYLGFASRTGVLYHVKCQFSGDRQNVRLQSVAEALSLLSVHIDDRD